NKWFNVPRVWRARPDMRSCLNHGACLGKSSRRDCSKTEMNAESDNENWSSVLESADNGGVSGNERETPTVADFNISVASTQGKRTSMEDQHAADQLKCGEYTIPYFAVYDGHGGVEAAEYAKRKMPGIIAGTLQMHLQKRCSENTAQAMSKSDIWNALKLSFVKLNDAFNQEHPDLVTVGTTALFSLIIDGKLWTASAGDSRAVLLRSDETVALTSDAKPSVEKFKTSVEKRGGYITFGRVAHYNEMGVLIGGLAVARAIGDASAKGISARPKITCVDWRPTDTLILACDGPFEVGSRMQVAKCVRTHGKQNWQTAADAVIKNASCSKDNMTVMVIGQNQDASSLTQS
ncbi:MAG: PP2C family protein-serine/threonine phosphatase, partial [Gammaproteobacteria bacterium]